MRAKFNRPTAFDYNLIVIGAGSAGLVTAYIAAAINAKVALVERDKMGGECLNTGCVPSKALLKSASLVAAARDSNKLGIRKMHAEFDFADVMQRVHDVIAKIAPHDSVERYTALGVDCIQGEARITSPWTVEVATCSARDGVGIDAAWEAVRRHQQALESSGELVTLRAEQARHWLWAEVQDSLVADLRQKLGASHRISELEKAVADGLSVRELERAAAEGATGGA